MADSSESRALRKSADVFKKSVDPDAIICPLYGSSLLTPEERAKGRSGNIYERVDAIFVSLERRVAVKPDNFHKLVKILRGVAGLKPLGEQLQALYSEECTSPVQIGAPSERGCERGQMVVQAPQFPSHAVPATNSRYAYPKKDDATPQQNMIISTNSFSSYGSRDTQSEDGARLGSAPVQDSQQHHTQANLRRPRHMMSPSNQFRKNMQSIQTAALRAGVTPVRSRKLEDLTRKYNSLLQQYDNERVYLQNKVDRLSRENDELETILEAEREEFDTEMEDKTEAMSVLMEEMEKLQLENDELKQREKAMLEKNAASEADLKDELERQREKMKTCKCLQNEAQKKLCLEIYDTTLELDYTLQAVLEDETVHDEKFKARMKELKTEVEEKKNATWP